MNRVPYDQLDEHPEAGDICTLHNEPFTGVAYSTWSNGAVLHEWSLRDGLLWGPCRAFSSDGLVISAVYYVAGLSHGAYRTWFLDGRKQSITVIRYGVTIRAKDWDCHGAVVREYEVGSEADPGWYLGIAEKNRREYEELFNAENMPEEYTMVSAADWD